MYQTLSAKACQAAGTTPAAFLKQLILQKQGYTNTYGPAGDADDPVFSSPTPKDFNGDGFYDLVCHVYTQQAAFQIAEKGTFVQSSVIGKEFFWGTNAVTVAP